MRNRSKLWFIFVFIFLAASYGYYHFDFVLENHSLFLSLSTFLFAIFSGFFISRQSTRYSNLTTEISRFDGGLTFVYRTSGVLGKRFQDSIGIL